MEIRCSIPICTPLEAPITITLTAWSMPVWIYPSVYPIGFRGIVGAKIIMSIPKWIRDGLWTPGILTRWIIRTCFLIEYNIRKSRKTLITPSSITNFGSLGLLAPIGWLRGLFSSTVGHVRIRLAIQIMLPIVPKS